MGGLGLEGSSFGLTFRPIGRITLKDEDERPETPKRGTKCRGGWGLGKGASLPSGGPGFDPWKFC